MAIHPAFTIYGTALPATLVHTVQTKLPHLATYLGHVSAVSTYYYLQLTPELRQSASQGFHQHFGSLITLDESVV